ncbi:hypothetical protein BY996DRAFT_8465475 [Phakopsora pachyrhizi]|nr:hypothetical protein BY996DRAFT_8465475 [Phakopsora pachyrhizi]
MSNFRLDTMEASKKAQSTSFSGLQAPPRIVNIAPTPPPASPAVTAPPSPAVHHSPLCHNPHPQLLSPVPSLLTSEAFTKPNLSSPNSDSSSYHQHEGVHVQRPAIGQRYSSDSASASSIGCRSVATSPSIQGQDETAGRVTPLASTDKRLQASVRTTSRCNVSHRRATSTIGFKNKRKPYAFSRTLSGSSTRSASPKAGGSSKIVGCVGSRGKGVQGDHAIADVSSNKPSDLEPFLEPNSSDASVATGTALSMHGGSTVPVSKAKVARASFAFVNQSHRSGSSVDGSLASANSLVVPVTPNNSQVSPSLQLRQGTTSTASSQITQCSSAFLPSAPPPTPAQNGVPLPTTMSARIGKSRAVEKKAEISFLKEVSTTEAIALKKKAKFYINGYETEEDAVLSSLSVPSQVGAHIPPGEVRGNLSNQQLTSEVQSSEMLRNPSHGSKAAPTKTNDGDDEEDSDGSDSDEWGSEYSDDDCDEEEEIAERLRLEELERKRQQEEYHRHLFAKKHFIQRNTSAIQDGESGLPPPIKRAGLSMLFHPELNHLKHHPQQKAVAESTAGATVAGGPNRNQSAIELRQGPRRPMNITRQSNEGDTSRRSFHAIPRPSSLIKSKSSIAVPVLAGHRPPEMVERSPSINSGGSSLPHHVAERAGIGGSGSGKSGGTNPITDVGINKHQRHPSRLKGKPENIEYSDDDESEEEQVGREEQERKLDQLALVANRGARAIAARPEPIAPPLSPRTTRRNMLANEMTESVRRNLLWERQIRTQSWGIVVGVASKDGKDAARGGNVALQGMKDGATTGVGDGKLFATTDVDRIKQQQQKYRTSSKGFHRTGW